ncbi:MAG: TIGR03936 family radical SAM-associated protein [Oscillospiraceae bacterium]|nr:TIGR03936 family radical SAM-associated protein [Oscillospiraceae bacterium]MBR5260702.1 TIGR03936 family radical SAM-associated protein [Oscillospiraceae bacterium]
MHKYRMLFKKTGRAVYISHLDLMRVMQRAFMRAGYQLKYSEGFNPHPQISILLPLSVGCSSQCELMDFQILGDENVAEMPARLTAVMPEGVEVLSVYETESKVKNLKYLRIGGVFEYDERDCAQMQDKLTEFFARESIVIEKKTKRGMGESDIKPAISEIAFTADERAVRLEAVISAQEPTLNPEHLVSALRQLAPEIAPDFAEFIRLEVFDEKMEIFR